MIGGYIKRKFNRLAGLPKHYRVIGAMAIGSPLLRNITTPAMAYDLYTDISASDTVNSLSEAFYDDAIGPKIMAYGAGWLALHAIQWGGAAYVAYGVAKHVSQQPLTTAPQIP